MEMGTAAVRLHVLIRTKSWLFPAPSIHRLHLLVDLDGKLLGWDHHPTLWLHPDYPLCCRPTGIYTSSISSFSTVTYTISRGNISRKRLCSVKNPVLIQYSSVGFFQSWSVGIAAPWRIPWGITALHARLQPQALQESSTAAFWGYTVKIPGLFCTQSGSLQGHIFCSAGSLAEMPSEIPSREHSIHGQRN